MEPTAECGTQEKISNQIWFIFRGVRACERVDSGKQDIALKKEFIAVAIVVVKIDIGTW